MSRQREQIVDFANAKLERLDARKQRRRLTPTSRGIAGGVVRDERHAVSFCDNDYLGLSQNERVIAAAGAAALKYGAGAGGSRLVTGDNQLNHTLENMLAGMKKQPAARVFGSGYLANTGTVPALMGPGDLVLLDELSHSCMYTGARLSGADVLTFRHNDVDDVASKLSNRIIKGRALVMTETVFSMDGDVAPLQALFEVCEAHDAWLMTDDAHGFGVVELDNPAIIQMGTLSKAVGAYGGYVCGPEELIDLFTSRVRTFVYTTGLPPAVLGAAIEALNIINSDTFLKGDVMGKAQRFAAAFDLPAAQSAIVPLIVGEEQRALDLQTELWEKGYHVSAIRPPTVPEGSSRLRFCFSAAHEDYDVDGLIDALKTSLKQH